MSSGGFVPTKDFSLALALALRVDSHLASICFHPKTEHFTDQRQTLGFWHGYFEAVPELRGCL